MFDKNVEIIDIILQEVDSLGIVLSPAGGFNNGLKA